MRDNLISKAELGTAYERKDSSPIWVNNYRAIFNYALRIELFRVMPMRNANELLEWVTCAPYEDGTYRVFIDAGLDEWWRTQLIDAVRKLPHVRETFIVRHSAKISIDTGREASRSSEPSTPPRLGERVLLLVLRTKEERVNIPGDLEEEFKQIAAKHGARYAKLWYYKQVAASAWPLFRKAVGWGMLASLGAWIRRYI